MIARRILALSGSTLQLVHNVEAGQVLSAILLDGIPFMLVAFAMVWFRWLRWPALLFLVLGWTGYMYGLEWLGWRWHHPGWSPALEGVAIGLQIYGTGLLDRWFAHVAGMEKAGTPV